MDYQPDQPEPLLSEPLHQSSDEPQPQTTEVTTEAETTTTVSTSSTTFVTAHEVTITPSSSSNKVFITTSMSYNLGGTNTSGQFNFRLQRGTTTITDTSAMRSSGSIKRNASEFVQLDSPSTTSATTYRIQIRRTSGSDGLNYCEASEKSVMIAMEIAG